MSEDQLLDLLGSGELPPAVTRQFIDFCLWQQGMPAFVHTLLAANLSLYARDVARAEKLTTLVACARDVADATLSEGLPVMALAAVQGAASEIEQLAQAVREANTDAVSFYAARLAGWAGWVKGGFSDQETKKAAEENAYAQQTRVLSGLLSAEG